MSFRTCETRVFSALLVPEISSVVAVLGVHANCVVGAVGWACECYVIGSRLVCYVYEVNRESRCNGGIFAFTSCSVWGDSGVCCG